MIDFENWLQGVQAQLDHDTDRCITSTSVDQAKIDLIAQFERITYIMDEEAWAHDRLCV